MQYICSDDKIEIVQIFWCDRTQFNENEIKLSTSRCFYNIVVHFTFHKEFTEAFWFIVWTVHRYVASIFLYIQNRILRICVFINTFLRFDRYTILYRCTATQNEWTNRQYDRVICILLCVSCTNHTDSRIRPWLVWFQVRIPALKIWNFMARSLNRGNAMTNSATHYVFIYENFQQITI